MQKANKHDKNSMIWGSKCLRLGNRNSHVLYISIAWDSNHWRAIVVKLLWKKEATKVLVLHMYLVMRKGRLRANVSAVWLYCSCCSAPVLYNQLSGWPILCRLQPSIRMNLGSSCVCAEFFFLSVGTFWDPTGSTASKRSSDGSHLTRIKYILKQKIKCSGCQRHGSV